MIAMLHRGFDTSRCNHRTYVISSGDNFSALKAAEFEATLSQDASALSVAYDIAVVPRARNIHQNLLTTPLSAIQCLLACFSIIKAPTGADQTWYPDVIVSNGPGTAVCVVTAAVMLQYLGLAGTRGKMRIVFVESWARVRTLSLTGKILLPIADRFLVQWEALAERYERAEYCGVLV